MAENPRDRIPDGHVSNFGIPITASALKGTTTASTGGNALEPGPGTGKGDGDGKMIEIRLKAFDHLPKTSNRWNSNEDVASILVGAQAHPEWMTGEVRILPPSGTQILYRKKEGVAATHYKQDGYLWKRRKDGKLPREDHMKLKVKGVELIYANYVHSALVPTFHRRAYWLLSNTDVILVHYLNVSPAPSADSVNELSLPEKLMNSLRLYGYLSRQELMDQLTPMLCSPVVAASCVGLPVEVTWVEKLVENVKAQFHQQLLQKQQQSGSQQIPGTQLRDHP